MSEKFTKGEWEFIEGRDNFGYSDEQSCVLGTIIGGDAGDVHICRVWNDVTDDPNMVEERANGHLLAASKAMYEALNAANKLMGEIEDCGTQTMWCLAQIWMEKRDAALRKARGES